MPTPTKPFAHNGLQVVDLHDADWLVDGEIIAPDGRFAVARPYTTRTGDQSWCIPTWEEAGSSIGSGYPTKQAAQLAIIEYYRLGF